MHNQIGGVEYDARPQPARKAGRHRAPEERPAPVPAPAWVDERARRSPALVGETATRVIRYPEWAPAESLPLPLPARARGAALDALRVPASQPKATLLGQCLHALGIRWPR